MNPSPKEIADALDYMAVRAPDEETGERFTLTLGSFRCSCDDNRQAIQRMAEKFRKGVKNEGRSGNWLPVGRGKLPGRSKAAVETFLQDVEIDNAEQMADLTGARLYWTALEYGSKGGLIRKATVLKDDPRFVVGVNPGNRWSVTHIDSGLSAAWGSSKNNAIEKFRALNADELEAAIAKAPSLS